MVMIHVLATITLEPGVRAEWLQHFNANVPAVLAEEGCVEYTPAIDAAKGLPNSPAPREDVAVVIEKWASIEALEAHLVAPHMAELREKVKGMVKSVDLQILESA